MQTSATAVAFFVFLFVSTAHAATLGIGLNQGGVYNVGDTIEITVTGDSQGEATIAIFGRLIFDNPSVADIESGTPTQNTLMAAGVIPWLMYEDTLECNSSGCNMFAQGEAFGLSPAPASNLLVATVSFLAVAAGTTNVSWSTDVIDGNQLAFFSLTNAPGTSFTVVPEAASAALLALGLICLTRMRRSAVAAAVALVAVALASSARAATIAIQVDQPVYLVGDTITITVTGDAQGGFDDHIFGRLVFSNPSVVAPLPPCDSSGCVIFDQPVPGFPSTLFVFTQSVLAASIGTTSVFWEDLDFFGLSNAPGAVITVVPEPASGALLGLALAGFAVTRWRRR